MAKKIDYDKEDELILKRKCKRFVLNTAIVCGVIGIAVGGLSLVKEGLIAAAAESKVENVRDKVIDENTHEIDFAVARKIGCNAKSWLYIPDTGIDYPLVQAQDNDFYVTHDCYGNESNSGAIFINYANAKDLSDAKTVIFGHNMLDESMFANLKNYSNEEWGKAHPDAYFFLDNGKVRHCRVRYYIYTDPYNENIYVTSKAEIPSVTAKLLEKDASIVYGEYTGGRLMCLSTCTLHKYRTVIVFEEVDDQFPLMVKGSEYFKETAVDCSEDAAETEDALGDVQEAAGDEVSPMQIEEPSEDVSDESVSDGNAVAEGEDEKLSDAANDEKSGEAAPTEADGKTAASED